MFYTVCIGLLFLTAFAAFFVLSYRYGLYANENRKSQPQAFLDRYSIFIFLVFALIGFFLCLYLILQNHYVYYWDYGGYWTYSYTIMRSFFANPSATIGYVYTTILENDYNDLLPLLIALPLKCFGYTFPKYVMINYVLFLVPVWLIGATIAKKQLAAYYPAFTSKKISPVVFTVTMFILATFTPFYYAMLHGYIDVACVVPALLSILLFMDYEPLLFNKRQILRDILISGLLLTAFLFRRYFAYFGVGYGTALFAYSLYKVITSYGNSKWMLKARNAILNVFVIGAFAACILLVFFRRLEERILENNYANQYEAYDADFMTKLTDVVAQLGFVSVILAVTAIVLALLLKKARKLTLFCTCSVIATTASFFTVQNMGEHHLYTIAGEVCMLMILGVFQILSLIKKNTHKAVAGIAISVMLGIGLANCFFPVVRPFTNNISWLYSKKYYPLQRNDIVELRKMADYLNNLTDYTDMGVYICASGDVLNCSIMDALNKPNDEPGIHHMYWGSDVDLRDGFSENFLYADYVVVTDPVQLHLKDGTQEVVRFLCEEIQKEASPIGRHFVRMEQSYNLDNNVTAYIYEKISDFETADYQYMAAYYDNYYPGMEDLFSNRIWNAAGN